MKRIHTLLLCVVLLLCGSSYAQEPLLTVLQKNEAKPLLFSTLPDQFECNQEELQKIFKSEINAPITLQLSGQFSIKGKVVDKTQLFPGSFSVNIKLENYQNALFNISIRLLADNSTAIQGRIVHPRYGDVLILYKNKDQYFFEKKSQRLFMPE